MFPSFKPYVGPMRSGEADFIEFITYIVYRWEGGDKLTNFDPSQDPGGLTRFGISQRYNPDVDVANLDWEKAMAIYFDRYWIAGKASQFPPPVALCMLDSCINPGVGAAARLLQESCGAAIDGNIGPATMSRFEAAFRPDPRKFVWTLMAARAARYLKRNDSVEEHNEGGWMNRVIDITTLAVGLL